MVEYICLDCGHSWNVSTPVSYLRCPRPDCRSSDVIPASFWGMVEKGRRLGIHPNSPVRDLIRAAKAVGAYESLIALGWEEFRRIMGRVIKEIERASTVKTF